MDESREGESGSAPEKCSILVDLDGNMTTTGHISLARQPQISMYSVVDLSGAVLRDTLKGWFLTTPGLPPPPPTSNNGRT